MTFQCRREHLADHKTAAYVLVSPFPVRTQHFMDLSRLTFPLFLAVERLHALQALVELRVLVARVGQWFHAVHIESPDRMLLQLRVWICVVGPANLSLR